MFGYIQPLKCELKVSEYDYYRAAYCGLCNSLRKRCGIKARFIVNYDFVFAALLLSSSERDEPSVCKKRCIVCPSGRNCVLSDAFDKVSDVSVILTYLKLCDDISDKSFFASLFKCRIPRAFLKKSYKRATSNIPGYATEAKKLFEELNVLEKEKITSIDAVADKFACMLAQISDFSKENKRILYEIFYHIGRYIYIIDALDDFYDDMQQGEYNPIASRFSLSANDLPKTVQDEVVLTLYHSIDSVQKAFELLPKTKSEGIIRNIIEQGMEASLMRVLKKGEKK